MIETIVLLIVLSLLGVADSVYLTWKHYRKQPLACPLNDKCEIVTESRWSKVFGIRNEVLGIIYYLFVIGGALYFFFVDENIKTIFVIFTGLALLFSLFLLFLQSYVIKSYCFYCLISALISLLIFLNSLVI